MQKSESQKFLKGVYAVLVRVCVHPCDCVAGLSRVYITLSFFFLSRLDLPLLRASISLGDV